MLLNNIQTSFLKEKRFLLLILGTLLISLGWYIGRTLQSERFILYFPNALDDSLVGEYRVLPREGSREDRISQLVEEVILGPSEILSYHIFTRETAVRNVFLMPGRSAVIDLDRAAMQRIRDRDISLEGSIDILKQTIFRNFPGLQTIRVLIDGQEVFSRPYAAP